MAELDKDVAALQQRAALVIAAESMANTLEHVLDVGDVLSPVPPHVTEALLHQVRHQYRLEIEDLRRRAARLRERGSSNG